MNGLPKDPFTFQYAQGFHLEFRPIFKRNIHKFVVDSSKNSDKRVLAKWTKNAEQ